MCATHPIPPREASANARHPVSATQVLFASPGGWDFLRAPQSPPQQSLPTPHLPALPPTSLPKLASVAGWSPRPVRLFLYLVCPSRNQPPPVTNHGLGRYRRTTGQRQVIRSQMPESARFGPGNTLPQHRKENPLQPFWISSFPCLEHSSVGFQSSRNSVPFG